MGNWFRRNALHFLVAAIFLLICFLYFTPAFQGKTLGQSDVIGAQSTQKEINDYRAQGVTILWTNQIFGGMPTFQIWTPYPGNITSYAITALKTVFPNPIDTVLLFLFGTYFLFIVLKLNPWLAAAGAIAFTFSSYNIILLVAGHSNQAFAIALFAPLLGAIFMTLRGRHFPGAALTALFMAMEIRANHIQMTYYLFLALLILLGIELYQAVKFKNTGPFFKSLGYLAGAGLIALAINASLLWSNAEYVKDSYRGKSNLTNNKKEPGEGLNKDYAYQYSQGVGECFTFLVPNAYGGPTYNDMLDQNSAVAKVFIDKQQPPEQAAVYARQISNSFPGLFTYWGEKRPSTAGPFYFGAGICFLFVLGLIVVKNRLKWWLGGTVMLTLLLSFGGNFPYVSDVFFNYFPFYNKFRAVESIIAVTGLCFPILAFLAIKETIASTDRGYILKKLTLTLYIVGGLLLLLIAIPSVFFNFKSSDHQQGITYLTQALKGHNALAVSISNAIVSDRESLERADAIRSLIFVVLTFGVIWAFIKQKFSVTLLSIGLLGIITVDLWQVDKRYLKESNFTDKTDAQVTARAVDNTIARDPDPDFRVFDASELQNLKQDTFNPFFHKSISGYSAARLKRYDELMDNQLLKTDPNEAVLNMLNAKYFINPDTAGNLTVVRNQAACGNAWYVKHVVYATNADREMRDLSNFSPKDTAIVDQQYKLLIDDKQIGADTTATISLVKYIPDHLTYQSNSTSGQLAVFSEIYYNRGWKMQIDGNEQPYFRADYLLRAAVIPAGKHKIEFIFHPASYYMGEKISMAGSALLLLALGGAIYLERKKKTSTKKV
ncbi:MAG: YfhO family protein [Mucilaginibacter sp.]